MKDFMDTFYRAYIKPFGSRIALEWYAAFGVLPLAAYVGYLIGILPVYTYITFVSASILNFVAAALLVHLIDRWNSVKRDK